MAKRKRNAINRGNEDSYSLIPRGKAYEPLILVQDVPSLGRSTRPCGVKTGRQHDFLKLSCFHQGTLLPACPDRYATPLLVLRNSQ